jgi:hypothetical protein
MRYLNSLILFSGLLALAASLCLTGASADAATISSNNAVLVLRVGDGTTALSANSASVFLEEYAITYTGTTPTGATHVQTIPVDDPNGAILGTGLTIAGTSSLEGGLNFSTNGQYLMFAGYHGEVGEGTSGKRKIIGRVDLLGNDSYDAIYGSGTTAAGAAIRTAASQTGNEYWFGMTNAAVGVSHRTWEGPPGDDGDDPGVASTLINAQNPRRLEIFNGQLYVSSAATGVFGVATVGSGTPTSAGAVTVLPGMPTTTGPSPVDFFFADANTLYVADDRTSTSGGLQKWAFDSGSGNWMLVYTKNIDTTNDTIDNGLRGLTGSVDALGNVTLFGTSTFGTNATANFLVGVSDTLANTNPASVTVNSLASSANIPGAAGALTTFRGIEALGIEIQIIPEPASLVMLVLAGAMLLAGRPPRA